MEIPWVDRPPNEIIAEQVRFSLQPFDGPSDEAELNKLFDHLGSDDLIVFSSDYPHWQFDGTDAVPPGFSPELIRKIMIDNPMSTYPRLKESRS